MTEETNAFFGGTKAATLGVDEEPEAYAKSITSNSYQS
jgi:hypothetical protein